MNGSIRLKINRIQLNNKTIKRTRKFTLATLTRWVKLSTMWAISVSTLCISAFCFCAAAAAAAAVGPLPPPPPPPIAIPPALFIFSVTDNNATLLNWKGRKTQQWPQGQIHERTNEIISNGLRPALLMYGPKTWSRLKPIFGAHWNSFKKQLDKIVFKNVILLFAIFISIKIYPLLQGNFINYLRYFLRIEAEEWICYTWNFHIKIWIMQTCFIIFVRII